MRKHVNSRELSRALRFYHHRRTVSTQFPLNGSWPCAHPKPVVGTVYPHFLACQQQKRFLLGPFFKLARSGFAVAAGAAAGGAAYANHKFSAATTSISDKFERVSDWVGNFVDKIELPDFTVRPNDSAVSNGSVSVGGVGGSKSSESGSNGSGSSESGSNGSGSSESGSNGGSNGSNGGGGNEVLGAGALASSVNLNSADLVDDELRDADSQMIVLTRKMIEIRSLLEQIDNADQIKLPAIVVIGSQSSGKSSVLEGIVGHEFLPKGANMVTRRPIELTLVHTSGAGGAGEYCEFPALRSGPISSFREVQNRLTELNLAVPDSEVVSPEPIQLRVYSPNVPDLTLIDLPGYIQVVAAGQPVELKSRIAELCETYIRAPNIILAVSAADVDLANSTALRASRRVDPRGLRTIGVITKMDLVSPERGVDILLNREYPLRLGYVGLVTKVNNSAQGNLTNAIAQREREFFAPQLAYRSASWGVLRLRTQLREVLEQSMVAALEPAKRAIRQELAETAYSFKVQYNDRVLTPQSYLAQSADAFKAAFSAMSTNFGREEVRQVIKRALDQKGLDLLAETYWNAPLSTHLGVNSELGTDSANLVLSKPDQVLWQSKTDQLAGALTKLGVGRLSVSILVNAIYEKMLELKASSSFASHPLALQQIDDAVQAILSQKFYSTADQIENSIKPYKYEVDMDAREWQHSREYAYNLLKEEQRQCWQALNQLKGEIGAGKLSQLVKSLNALHPTENLGHFSGELIAKARFAAFLEQRIEILKAREVFVKSRQCKHRKNRAVCPEVFVDVVTSKLASTAVLFLNFELLSDFYYSFPRELDSRLQALTEQQVEELAHQDPAIKRHVGLQQRKELLTLALNKLQTISDLRDMGSEMRKELV